MSILNGIKNFLQFVNDSWTTIIVIIGLAIALAKKITEYISKSTDEKVEIAKEQISEVILRMITEAELDYEEWSQAGSIKRSQVIEEIYASYPILSKVVDQDSLIEWIDQQIDSALSVLRSVIEINTDEEEEDADVEEAETDEVDSSATIETE